MRIKKTIIAGVVISLIAWGTVGGAEGNDVNDINDLSAYYGFKEIEIIKLDRGITNLRTADFNGDGRNDIAIVNRRKAKIAVLLQKATVGPGEEAGAVDPDDVDVNQINPPTRFDKQSVPVSQKMASLACGDFNNDEMVDLAFYGEPKGLYVILQKAGEAGPGQAKTLSWRTRKKIKIDKGLLNPNALVCADLNNDGLDDLVLGGQDSIYIVYQEDDGSLGEPVEYATASRILGIEVGDLNGDGVNDLVLVTNDNEKPIQVRFGLKTGQLGRR